MCDGIALTFMSRGRRTPDHEIIKNREFDREVFCRLETELFHVKVATLSGPRLDSRPDGWRRDSTLSHRMCK